MKGKPNSQQPLVTYFFLIVMVILLVLMEIHSSSQNTATLILFGAKFNPFIQGGQFWRFLTPIFLHIGLVHLIMNGLIIYYLGSDLERIYGHWKYALIFLMSGLMGNIFSFAFNDAVSAGASTAVFGLLSTTLVLAKAQPNNPYLQAVAKNYLILIVVNIAFNLVSSGVDMAGHVGGLVGGYFTAAALSFNESQTRWTHAILGVLSAAIVLFIGMR